MEFLPTLDAVILFFVHSLTAAIVVMASLWAVWTATCRFVEMMIPPAVRLADKFAELKNNG